MMDYDLRLGGWNDVCWDIQQKGHLRVFGSLSTEFRAETNTMSV